MDQNTRPDHFSLSDHGLLPQEEILEVGKKRKKLIIGIPCEDAKQENRLALTPEAVDLLVGNGHEVLIEKGAGKNASYSDTDFSERGGVIVDTSEKIFEADVILKIAPVTLKEINLLRRQQLVFSSLQIVKSEKIIRALVQKKITAIAFENIMDKHNFYPVVRSMSEIAGITSVLVAAEYLSNVRGGKGVMLGGITGITPAEVVILGAGTAAEYATRAALGLGATVKIFDQSVHRLREIQNLIGHRLQTSVFHPQVLEKNLKSADVVIGAIHLPGGEGARYYITEDMVKVMKKGSVIVDISIDQGGCVETSEYRTHKDPVFEKHGVVHYSVSNIPSRVARTASIALSNVFVPILLELGESGGLQAHLKENKGLRKGVYLFNGILTNSIIGNKFGILSKDIDLLLGAF